MLFHLFKIYNPPLENGMLVGARDGKHFHSFIPINIPKIFPVSADISCCGHQNQSGKKII